MTSSKPASISSVSGYDIAVWPRSGGDRGNRRVMPVDGAALRGVTPATPLSGPADPPGRTRIAGGATAADGSLRVVLRGVLFAIDPDRGRSGGRAICAHSRSF